MKKTIILIILTLFITLPATSQNGIKKALRDGVEAVKEGVTTKYLDDIIRNHIIKSGAKPSFLGYGGFPGSACISINEQVIHGIPSHDVYLQEGDIVKIDVGAYYKGYHGDSANTFPVGTVSEEAETLIRVTKESFQKGIETLGPGSRLGDLGAAVLFWRHWRHSVPQSVRPKTQPCNRWR